MKKLLASIACVLALISAVAAAQGKPVLVVQVFTTAKDVSVPYDLKQLHAALVAELKVELKNFDVVGEAPAAGDKVYTLAGEITEWKAGNAAKRLLVGLGSGRESAELHYTITDASGKKFVDKKDTIRTNFFSQGAGSTGTLSHPFAEKISERIKDAKLK